MLKLHPVAMVFGVVLVAAVMADAFAATPEEQAVFREEARKLTEQARGLEQQADIAYEQAKVAFIFEYKKGDGLEDQADARLNAALQKWHQGGAPNQAQALLIRESARALLLDAYQSELLALLVDELAANERARATQLRAQSAALLASGTDAETQKIARLLNQQAAKNDRGARMYDSQAERLLADAGRMTQRAETLIQRAARLETSP